MSGPSCLIDVFREGVYGEIYRVLRPGAVFACYEWCLTDKHDASNEKHRLIKKQIEVSEKQCPVFESQTNAVLFSEVLVTPNTQICENHELSFDVIRRQG